MATKPNFRSNAVSRIDLTSTLQRGALSREPEETEPKVDIRRVEPAPQREQAPQRETVQRRPIDSRKKKLASLKTLLEYEEKKEITALLRDISDVVGHNVQLSIFNRGLLLAVLEQRDAFLRAAEKLSDLERPSNGDVQAFREYEAKIGQMIFSALDIRGTAPTRK